MKKGKILIFSILMLLTLNVNATLGESSIGIYEKSDGGGFSYEFKSKEYFKSNQSIYIRFDADPSGVKPNKVEVSFGGMSCTLDSYSNSHWSNSGNVFTVKQALSTESFFDTIYYSPSVNAIYKCNVGTTEKKDNKSYKFSMKVYDSDGKVIESLNSTLNYLIVNVDYYKSHSELSLNNINFTGVTWKGDDWNTNKNAKLYNGTVDSESTKMSVDYDKSNTICTYNLSDDKGVLTSGEGREITGPVDVSVPYDVGRSVIINCFPKILNDFSKFELQNYYGLDIKDETFCFSISRIDRRSNISDLSSLSLSGVNFSFKSDQRVYITNVKNNVSSTTISATLKDPKSKFVDGYGPRKVNLNEGTNKIEVKVQSEKGSVTTYIINITRELSNDCNLKKIFINDNEIIVNNDLKYKTFVSNDIVDIDVKWESSHSKSVVELEKPEKLVEGDNEVTLTVTAPDGTKKIYMVNVIRDTLISSDSTLKNVVIKNYKENDNDKGINKKVEFDGNNNFNIKLNKDIVKLDLEIETNNEKANVVVSGNKDLKNKSVIKIKVTAEDNETVSNYTITVEKDSNILLIIIIISSVLVVGVVTFIIIKSKKHK